MVDELLVNVQRKKIDELLDKIIDKDQIIISLICRIKKFEEERKLWDEEQH